METQKYENMLNLALQTPPDERKKSQNLNVGYEEADNSWDLIVKYNGNLTAALMNVSEQIKVSELLGGFAVLNVPERYMDIISSIPEIEFVEKPKRLYFALNQVRSISCVNPLLNPPYNLSGEGVCFALIDSGIDYTHPDFRNEDGTTRILYLWDQTKPSGEGTPSGYYIGREYTGEEINAAIASGERISEDGSGHGTGVAGVAAGNGISSNGRYKGIASKSSIIAVKMGTPDTNSFPRTTELMLAVNYCINKAMQLNLPVAVNISFGNNYGSHDGNSLLEAFLNQASSVWKNVICVGTGNEGARAGHFYGKAQKGVRQRAEFIVGPYESKLNVQLWKNYADDFEIYLIDPSGNRITFYQKNESQRFNLGNVEILVYYGEPKPYTINQEIYVDFIPDNMFINEGIWAFEIIGQNIVVGDYNLWLPVNEGLSSVTEFLRPAAENTFTVPAAASRVITVAAYNGETDSYADFSGRGRVVNNKSLQKPDIAAPGVNIMSTSVGGGYSLYSGTSFATPVITGMACLMMQYGIVQGKDDYLYGEKIKAKLIKGARKLPGNFVWPNAQLGYGAACLRNSLP